jgi:hypothetical protein
VRSIPNRNDDGTVNTTITSRQVTGLLVRGTAEQPVIYVSSSDFRIGGTKADGTGDGDTGLDTNSGVVSRLTKTATGWNKVDLVRGLPRSEENHSPNGMQLDESTNTLYLAVGGNTNHGAPSNNFALLPEVALSAAILSIDLDAIGNTTYDLPTLDDPARAGTADANDPFGGNDGNNQARLVSGGPVQVYASGFRNPYDLLITQSAKMYAFDNGPNPGWGAFPIGEGPAGNCTNGVSEPGVSYEDQLHYVSGAGYYGGHPNPTRGNTANTFAGQSPVPQANPIECDYLIPGQEDGALTTNDASTNGLAEYTASDFGGAMQGNLLAASFDGTIYRLQLNATGDAVTSKEALFTNFGTQPLDVTTQGDADPFPGTVWAAVYGSWDIQVFEPEEGGTGCAGTDDPALDEDADGFDNADEIANATNPCSAASVPADADGDKDSNLNDPDDDNDGTSDSSDPFAVDPNDGTTTNLPVSYTWDNDAANPGGLLNLGFTGLMTNKTADYMSLYDPANMTAGGAAGVTTVDKVPDGDAYTTRNTQKYGFQFGVNTSSTSEPFTAHTRILAPFVGITPENNQSMGLFIGTGDQDNYVKLTTHANGGAGGIQVLKEGAGAASAQLNNESILGSDYVDLYLTIDPDTNKVQPSYSVNGGERRGLGTSLDIPASWLGPKALAIGIISTSRGLGAPFAANWDFIKVSSDSSPTHALKVSTQANRSGATDLAGSTLSGKAYVFSGPDAGVSRVDFWLDNPTMSGTPTKVEKEAPFDFKGGTVSTANPWDTTRVADGSHTITAKLYLSSGGTETTSATFTVGEATEATVPDQVHLAWIEEPSTTITTVWRTQSDQTPSEVQYRVVGETTWKQATGTLRPSGTTGTLHEATIRSLTPATAYEYRVRGDGGTWSPIFSTRTAPPQGPADFDAIYFADTGLVGRRDGLTNDTQQVIDEIAKINPLLLLPGGDYASFNTDKRYGTLDNTIDAWFKQMQPATTQSPMMPTYGNHEAHPNLGEAYEPWAARFPTPDGVDARRNYSFDVGDVHFVSIFAIYGNKGLTSTQLQWIEQDIRAAKAAGMRWIIPYFHVSPFADGFVHPSNLALRKQLGPLFERLGVQLVLSSHDQSYERTYPLTDVPATNTPTSTSKTCYTMNDGVTWVKVSPAGKLSNKTDGFSTFTTTPPPHWTAFRDDTMHHFSRLHVSASGSIRLDTYGVVGDGTPPIVLDTFVIRDGSCAG